MKTSIELIQETKEELLKVYDFLTNDDCINQEQLATAARWLIEGKKQCPLNWPEKDWEFLSNFDRPKRLLIASTLFLMEYDKEKDVVMCGDANCKAKAEFSVENKKFRIVSCEKHLAKLVKMFKSPTVTLIQETCK
jgi:hypothetical protein